MTGAMYHRFKGFGAALLASAAITIAALAAPVRAAGAERFAYAYSAGDKYRIVSTVREDVYVDRRLSHRSEILNRIAVDVRAVKDGVGTLAAQFQTSERTVGTSAGAGASADASAFQWSREYSSIFDRDSNGRYTIGAEYWMPVVRDVPVFPDEPLAPGDEWSAEGEEAHDFRDAFGIPDPYRIPFIARYRYLGEKELEGRKLPAFSVSYRIFEEPAPPARRGARWPTRIMGASDQIVYWDRDLGQPAAYEEDFRIVFELSDGRTVEYRGDADALVVEAAPMERGRMADEIAQDIARLGITDTGVRVTEEGVAISLEDVRFNPDSAELVADERTKLDRIAEILARYADRDILVGGHTALAGTEAGRQSLSEQRAAAVAEYFVKTGVRDASRIVTRGFGATEPVADNASEEGRRRNRRVEITILEN